ncbi:transcriptional activator of glycolytic enzymes-domain-containing protein [Radiomyces spectabilis]|uniref:transcriptional activator of glycolytic enzymes-domain-containing protein n=1 Tax=Radiomyces spectabilis TaxID=64574 RepID=UPI0022211D7C|nr:transcriptional activator of glycolytic enzymes-domain-containing protein [Radiomyces spectabilis]KAI8376245.1 transcriptional activator of glycolytic enzymes-domain-containing protein [Radiomyces spectabilis]
MSRSVTTVTDLWRKWSVGLAAIRQLEENHGARWRSGDKGIQMRFLHTRLRIIRAVEGVASERGITEVDAADILENRRSTNKRSLNKLSKSIRAQLPLSMVVFFFLRVRYAHS